MLVPSPIATPPLQKHACETDMLVPLLILFLTPDCHGLLCILVRVMILSLIAPLTVQFDKLKLQLAARKEELGAARTEVRRCCQMQKTVISRQSRDVPHTRYLSPDYGWMRDHR